MTLWIGDNNSSEYYATLHAKWVHGFNTVFWNDTLGYYMDWVDIKGSRLRRLVLKYSFEKGVPHSYFYVDQNSLAIIFGMANKTQAKSILSNLDSQYPRMFYCRTKL